MIGRTVMSGKASTQHRRRRIRRSDTERILSGLTPAGGMLGEVLRAAAAPPLPAELARENIALRAFRARSDRLISVAAARVARRGNWFRLSVSMRISAVAAIIAVALAGVAVADSGVLTGASTPTVRHAADGTPRVTGVSNPNGGTGFASGVPTVSSSRVTGPLPGTSGKPSGSAAVSSSTTPSTSATTSPGNLRGQCKAYLNEVAKGRTPPATDNAYRKLVDAAGGAGNVEAYCDALLGITSTSEEPSASHHANTHSVH